MKFKSKAARSGFIFGNVCKFFGTLSLLIFLPLVGNEQTLIDKRFLIVSIISSIIAGYGLWRTGGINYDE